MIILISGPQGSGKSTLANELLKQFGPCGAIKQKFAQPLYEMHNACRNILEKYGVTGYDYVVKDGDLLQLLGTEWGRDKIRPTVWTECLHNAIRNSPRNLVHIIEDCRFKNEFDSFSGMQNVLRIRLSCPEDVRKTRAEMWRDKTNHQSEIDLDGYAENMKFDMYFHTEKEPVQSIVDKVMFRIKALSNKEFPLEVAVD